MNLRKATIIFLTLSFVCVKAQTPVLNFPAFIDTAGLGYNYSVFPDSSYSKHYYLKQSPQTYIYLVYYYKNGITKKIISNYGSSIFNFFTTEYNYYPSGEKLSINNYLKNNKYGFQIEWYKNGNVKSIENYALKTTDSSIVFESLSDTTHYSSPESGIISKAVAFKAIEYKDGVFTYYNIEGKLIRRETWQMGVLLDKKEY